MQRHVIGVIHLVEFDDTRNTRVVKTYILQDRALCLSKRSRCINIFVTIIIKTFLHCFKTGFNNNLLKQSIEKFENVLLCKTFRIGCKLKPNALTYCKM